MNKRVYISLISEIIGLIIFFSMLNVVTLSLFLVLHGIASFMLLSVLIPLSPKTFNKKIFWLLFCSIYFTGPIGIVGSFIFYLILLKQYREFISIYESVNIENVPNVTFKKREIGEGILQITNPKVVVYMSKFTHPVSVNFLKNFTKNDNDEIRLLAFSTLLNMEKNIIDQINLLNNQLENIKNKGKKCYIFYSLGELYWELVYLNIPEQELIPFYLNEALRYIKQALEIEENPKFYFLLGRIYLKLNEIDSAQDAFYKALKLGFPEERVVIYLLEVYYIKKDFLEIFNILKKFKNFKPLDYKTESILKVWQ
ncbi:tetratricopeptide repeat protein [Thermodesulfovibrio thiophilus]|uniref:tetratricopeptide repeat protein n=1 Tax=Thermodesulfovibrio thiophilus TaxID=340095 RepID=UPI0004021BC5|nr:hypothetical protein [Thermodesulfovibrio thiophilus]HHW20815.1 hypothetical protein [Thermodesulfovibrio thiophilus]